MTWIEKMLPTDFNYTKSKSRGNNCDINCDGDKIGDKE